MKSVGFLKTLGSVVAMVVACNVYAQASDATATGTTAAPAASAKAGKKANSQLGRKVRARSPRRKASTCRTSPCALVAAR